MSYQINYIFVGPERTGTTWIYEYLSCRKDINFPIGTKETFFFDHYYHKGIQWYNKHFKGEQILTVEVAPTYFKSELAPHRIKKHIPHTKIICTLRNPLKRSISHYNHLIRYGQIRPVFNVAVKASPEIIKASLYYKNIIRWIDVFGRKNIYFLIHEQLKSGPDYFVRDLCNILNIDFCPPPNFLKTKKVNPLTSPRSVVLASLGSNVKNFFRSHQLYSVVEFAKKIGLRKVFFGRESKSLYLPGKEETVDLVEMFSKDLDNLSQLFQTDFDDWIYEMNRMIK